MLALSDEDCKTANMKMFQKAMTNMLETNDNIRSLRKKNRRYKEKHRKILDIKFNMTKFFFFFNWMGLMAEWREQRKELVCLSIQQ